MTRPIAFVCALALAGLSARAADAAVCAEIDATKDNLSAPDRAAALTLLVQALRNEGQEVAAQGCTGTYRVYHVRLGASVNVVMQGPQGTREGSVAALEQVPALYGQMIRSLLIGASMGNEQPQHGVVMPRAGWVGAEGIWYARLGASGTAGPVRNLGPSVGFGYRYLRQGFGIDVSAVNMMFTANEGQASGTASLNTTASWFKVMGLYVASPAVYLGAGLSWGAVGVADDVAAYNGRGFQGEVSAGWMALRAGTVRLFVQADATLPFYSLERVVPLSNATAYVPVFGVSVGLGRGQMLAHIM